MNFARKNPGLYQAAGRGFDLNWRAPIPWLTSSSKEEEMNGARASNRDGGVSSTLQDKTSSTGVEDRKTKMAFLGWCAEEPKVGGGPGDERNDSKGTTSGE